MFIYDESTVSLRFNNIFKDLQQRSKDLSRRGTRHCLPSIVCQVSWWVLTSGVTHDNGISG